MRKIYFYTRENCVLCEEAFTLLEVFQHLYGFEIEQLDIESNDAWLEEYQLVIPVIQIQNAFLYGNEMEPAQMEGFLQKAFA